MRAGNRPRLSSLALALGLVCAAGVVHADWRESYSRGLAALKDGDYAAARKLLEQALAEQPEPAVRTRLYGQRWEPYLPQHYLGLAAFQQGDCATALAQWNSGPSQQVVAQLPEIRSEQQRASANCEQKLAARGAAPAKPPVVAPPVVAVAEKASPPGASATRPPASKPAEEPPAKTVASIDKPPPARVEPPKPPAEKAAESAKTPPASLIEAFDEFLAGRYREVGRIEPKSYADARARFHAYVVRAAARYTLAEISGDKDLLESARADARAARALDGKAVPDGALFSPRFRAFYREGS